MTAKKKTAEKPPATVAKAVNPGSFKPGNPGGPGRGNKKKRPEDDGDWRLLEDMEWVHDHPNEPTTGVRAELQKKLKTEVWEWIKEYNAVCRRLKVGNRADDLATVARETDAGEQKVEETILRILEEVKEVAA